MKKRHLSVMPSVILALLLTGLLIACPGTTDPVAVAVESVSIDGGNTGALVETEKTLVATVLPETATNQAVTWESSDTDIATIDNDGVVTPKTVGTTDITVTTDDGNYTDTITLTVSTTAVAVTGVSIDQGDTASVNTGKTTKLTATVTPGDATDSSVTWESSDETVATIDNDGVVTPKTVGTTTITVTTNGVNSGGNSESATIEITVVTGAITGTLSYSDDIETTYGTEVSGTPTFDGAPTTGVKTYSISPAAGGDMPTGITIDTGTGVVTVGETVDVQTATDYTVSVKVAGFSGIKEATITVTVTSKALVGTLSYTAISVNAGTSGSENPGFGNWVSGQTVSYTISPDDVSGISIDAVSGKVTVGTSAVIADSGTYTVTATATGNFHGTISFNITITVT